MSKNYDNWERLVDAVLRREQLREIALIHSSDDDESSCSSFSSNVLSHDQFLGSKWQSPRSRAYGFDEMSDGFSWERFLPPEYRGIAPISVPGKRIFLPVEARELVIWSGDYPEGPVPYSTRFPYSTRSPSSRLTEVVEVSSVLWLDIRGTINTRMLTPNTVYGAYLVFIISDEKSKYIETAKAMIRYVNDETDGDAEQRAKYLHCQPVSRDDGWVEVRMASFFVGEGDEQELEVRLLETSCRKSGLFIEGIEFRPLVCVKQV